MAGSLRANELARAALDETALAGACVDLVSARGTATVAGGLLATSFVVRKLVLEPREPYSCSALDAYVRWPRSLGEMQTWLAAADFLLAEPPAAYVAFLLDAAARAHGLCSGQVLRCPLDPMAASGEGLEEHLRRWMLEARAPEADAYAPPAGAAARPDVPLLTTTPADLAPAAWLRCCWQLLRRVAGACERSYHLFLVRRQLQLSVLAFAEAPAPALELLAAAPLLWQTRFCEAEAMRLLVYVALRRLYLAEKAGEHWPVPLETAAGLQTLYREGVLDLDAFVPCPRPCARPWYVLSHLPGRRYVPQLRGGDAVRATVCAAVPWLAGLLGGDVPLYLTGSLLAWALREAPALAPRWAPGDVDIFCEAPDDLEAATARVAAAMHSWLAAHGPGDCGVRRYAPSATRRVLEVCAHPRGARGLEAAGREHASALRCDVYVNSQARMRSYHVPAVRCSLLLTARRELVLNPSCALALITSLNVDYAVVPGRKMPLEILERKWRLGFNFCLTWSAARHLCLFLGERDTQPCPVRLHLRSFPAPEPELCWM